ncbi:unnamed protein product, partial [Wuchereria bancrofti]
MIVAKLLHRRKLAADVAKQREDEIRLLLDSLNKSILHEVIDKFIQDISKKWIIKCQRVHNEELIEDIGKSFLNDLLTGMVVKTVRKIAEKEIEESVNYVKQRLKNINERLDKLWLKQFVNCWREQISYRKERERKKLELLGSFPVILPAKSGLIFRRRDGHSLDEALQLDCSSLLFEQKINAFIKKRHGRIARKVLTKWRLWAHLQIEKREFFTSTYTSSPLKRKRLHSNNNIIAKESGDIRLAAALADMECERLKPFWATNQICNDLEDKRQVSWYESLVGRSSVLLNFFDEKTLEKGVEIAERNIQRTDYTERWMTNKNNLECNGSLNGLTCNVSQQQYYKKNNEFSVQN